MVMYEVVGFGTCVCLGEILWLNVFPALSAVAALCFSSAGSTSESMWLELFP